MWLLLACSPNVPDPEVTPDPPPKIVQPMTHITVENGQAIYDECRPRVEGPAEAAGECTTDADCARAGCNGEVCATAAEAPDLMTTCEIRLCYHLLDSCSCVEGVCGWSIHPDGESVETWPFRGSAPPAAAPEPAATPPG